MPPDLEPAGALAVARKVLNACAYLDKDRLLLRNYEVGAAIIEADRASVREQLETQLDELRRRLHEQADVIAERDRRIGELQASVTTLRDAIGKVPYASASRDGSDPWLTCMGCGKTGSAACRSDCWVARLERAYDGANGLVPIDAFKRIASLEAQLASAREEALRELIDRLRAEAGLHSAYDCTVLSMAIEGLLELLPATPQQPSRVEPGGGTDG